MFHVKTAIVKAAGGTPRAYSELLLFCHVIGNGDLLLGELGGKFFDGRGKLCLIFSGS